MSHRPNSCQAEPLVLMGSHTHTDLWIPPIAGFGWSPQMLALGRGALEDRSPTAAASKWTSSLARRLVQHGGRSCSHEPAHEVVANRSSGGHWQPAAALTYRSPAFPFPPLSCAGATVASPVPACPHPLKPPAEPGQGALLRGRRRQRAAAPSRPPRPRSRPGVGGGGSPGHRQEALRGRGSTGTGTGAVQPEPVDAPRC